jgi:hypothetical protein
MMFLRGDPGGLPFGLPDWPFFQRVSAPLPLLPDMSFSSFEVDEIVRLPRLGAGEADRAGQRAKRR